MEVVFDIFDLMEMIGVISFAISGAWWGSERSWIFSVC